MLTVMNIYNQISKASFTKRLNAQLAILHKQCRNNFTKISNIQYYKGITGKARITAK